MRIFLAITAVILPLFAATGARTEIFSACSVQSTPDGFVALRDGPSPTAKLLAKMHPGEIVVVDVKNNAYIRSAGWLRVSHFPGEATPNPGDPDFDKVKRGWAKDKLIDDCG
ncbi:hypothetical protein [Methylocystis parvus]|uniref:SH3 domain-containing protein n=1 Tax=Methylocystis parvus TaxID=134 RepID=A0A6B8M871_9HYPH|nr:hypothetical protein [Methylocystis parvus]QGM98605.1 hypothetical protein F7D14_14710 [Methylocystis parvus]WBK01052.1 hypothetical protein MMG94_04860 [Methylocystis parvus OBBP]